MTFNSKTFHLTDNWAIIWTHRGNGYLTHYHPEIDDDLEENKYRNTMWIGNEYRCNTCKKAPSSEVITQAKLLDAKYIR